MKSYWLKKGHNCSTVSTVENFFEHLEETGFLTKNNFLTLQSILITIGRKDLCNEVTRILKKENNLLFFESFEMEPDYLIKVKLNVELQDSMDYISRVQSFVERLLVCYEIKFVGCEHGCVIFVFKISEESETFLKDTTDVEITDMMHKELTELHVMYIEINGERKWTKNGMSRICFPSN
ncbi:hypothetical protein ScPMuIL_017858 [Solemya velum]